MATASTGNYINTGSPLNFGITSNESNTNKMPNYKVLSNGSITSLFGNTKFVPFPNGVSSKGDATGGIAGNRAAMHNDDIYDITIGKLIDFTKDKPSMLLTAAHFAYLKDVGVYPNNRLMIARRFPSAVGNDLTAVTTSPLATMISWVPNDNDFIDISFGERWESAEASFEDVLGNGGSKNIGNDLTLSNDNRAGNQSLGINAGQLFSGLPLPGLMEGIQRQMMINLGIADPSDISILPQGNPNLIKQAMRRSVVDKGAAGSGLKCEFSVKMKVEYEQYYINGIDNTLSYFDLISNVLSFATSDSEFMYNKIFAQGADNILTKLISGDINAVIGSISLFVQEFINVLTNQAKIIAQKISDISKQAAQEASALASSVAGNKTQTPSSIQTALKFTLGAVIGKYKMRLIGIISALTGQPSTPWHITIGNPKRPLFSSGDMVVEDVRMKLGPVLAWNDLPSSISVDFTLKNARPLGAQEIFNRFNTGKARSYVRLQPDIASSNSKTNANLLAPPTSTTQNTSFGPAPVSNQGPNGDQGNLLQGNGTTTPLI